MELGSRILAWLKLRNQTQKWLADKVGVSPGAVTAWVKPSTDPDSAAPTNENLVKVVEALGLTMVEFYGGVPDKTPPPAKRSKAKRAAA